MRRDGMFCYDSFFITTIIEDLTTQNEALITQNEALKAEVAALREELKRQVKQ